GSCELDPCLLEALVRVVEVVHHERDANEPPDEDRTCLLARGVASLDREAHVLPRVELCPPIELLLRVELHSELVVIEVERAVEVTDEHANEADSHPVLRGAHE